MLQPLHAGFLAGLFSLAALAVPLRAQFLNPVDFSSLGFFNATGDVFVNTDTMAMTGGASFTGVSSGGSTVFTFSDIQLSSSYNIYVTGSAAFAFLSLGDATISGIVAFGATNPGSYGGDGGLTGGGEGEFDGAGFLGQDGQQGLLGFDGVGGISLGMGGGGGNGSLTSEQTDLNIVPEPATVVMITLAGMLTIFRRRSKQARS